MSKQKISKAINTTIKMLYFDKFLCDTSRNTVRFDTRIKIKTNNFCFVLMYGKDMKTERWLCKRINQRINMKPL